MLTSDEKKFMEYWKKNRERESTFLRQLSYGAPWGLVFALPVLVAVIFHDWYRNMIPISLTQLILIMVAVLLTAGFYAVFRMKYKWEQYEQYYKALLVKEKKSMQHNDV